MKDAIIIRNTLFINAGAGSGKTYRLTHDLADYLTGSNDNGHNAGHVSIDPQEVIVTTFSKAASAEIKERARQVLLAQGRTEDATRLETAGIGTIHAVAQKFINQYWYHIGACPNQDVLSDEDKAIYRNQSLATFLENHKDFARQQDAVNAFYKTFKPQKAVNNIPQPYPEFWAEDVEKIVQKVSYYQIEDLADSREMSIKEIDSVFAECMEESKRQILKNCVAAVFDIAERWLEDYASFKRKIGVIDYDDMEKGFYRLLTEASCKDVIAKELRSKYKLVMVDEFQDCNPMQLQIFSKISDLISGNSSLPYSSIWVGDPNQAIYGFRGSDTDLINRVKAKFTATYPAKTDADDRCFSGLSKDSLDTSYRSREELVTYANTLFSMSREADDWRFFDEFTMLKASRKSDGRMGASVLQWNFQNTERSAAPAITAFARHIKEIVEESAYTILPKGEKETRGIRFGDIAVLAYKNADVEKIVAALREEGVPASAPESNIMDRAEIQLVLAMLNLSHTVCEGEGDAKKRVVAYRPHEFATILKLWLDKSTEEVLGERVDNQLSASDSWTASYAELHPVFVALEDSKGLPIDEKISSLILELDLYDKVKKWGDADVRRQNLNTLQKAASQFVARCSRMGIRASEKEFDKYLKTVEIRSDVSRNTDSVTVSTYHGSKGLEWPMVVLFSLNSNPLDKFHGREYYGVHEMQQGDGDAIISNYCIHYVPLPNGADLPTDAVLNATALCKSARKRLDGEMKQLFYVGLTRARDYVVYYCDPSMSRTGNPEGKVRWASDFTWLDKIGLREEDLGAAVEVFPPLVPYVLKEPQEPKRPKNETPTYREKKAKYDNDLAAYRKSLKDNAEAVEREKAIAESKKNPQPYRLHDLEALSENPFKAKYRHPSVDSEKDTQYEKKDFLMELLPAVERQSLFVVDEQGNDILRYRHATLGSCIHNIYAACPWAGDPLTGEAYDEYLKVAAGIVRNYRMGDVIKDVEPLVKNLLCLYSWLQSRYGAPTRIVHEYPFCYPYGEDDKQIVTGEIDLVYCTEETDVIVDFKTHIGDEHSLADSTDDGRYKVGFVSDKYVPQLTIYRNIWQRAFPKKDIKTMLYYNILGGIVEV